ncbi:MAG: hypothetical protein ACFHXK_16900 [bacterium]
MSRSMRNSFNLTLFEVLFVAGLLAYTLGQFLIFVYFNDLEALHAQTPIDFAHWFLLIGLLLLVPQGMSFPKSRLHFVGGPLFVLGIGLLIGMCVLDFVFWSIDSAEQKRELATHLIATPAIWFPFMTVSGHLFNLGLLICGFSYLKYSKAGTALLCIGTFIVLAGGGWLNVLGYSVLTAGFATCFHHHNLPLLHQARQ